MRIEVRGNGPALALGALLAAAGHEVTTEGQRGALTVRGPDGWVHADLPADGGSPELVILDHGVEGAEPPDGAVRTIRVRGGWGADWTDPIPTGTDCLALFNVRPDGLQHLEIDLPGLIVPQDTSLRRLFGARSTGIRVTESRDIRAQLGSLLVLRLLDLPATLCNTTVPGLLADGEGRRIAQEVLVEGERLVSKLGLGPGQLPIDDPTQMQTAIRQRPDALVSGRYRPGQPCPALLDAIRRGVDTRPYVPQREMSRRATEQGVPADWNRRLVACLPRVLRAGFYASPLDLLRAVA